MSGSSSKGKQPAAGTKDWTWTKAENFILSDYPNLTELIKAFDHRDFRITRAWLCFSGENLEGDLATNHASLKFDLSPSNNHPWRGVKLEAQKLPNDSMTDPITEQVYTASKVRLGLRKYAGTPRGMRFCLELDTKFSSAVSHGTTIGGLIELLSRAGLLRFGFSEMRANTGLDLYVGCRDYM